MSRQCKDCIHNEVCDRDVGYGWYECPQYISADVVEVVRCKDCVHWKDTSVDIITEVHWGECCKPLADYRFCETAEYDFCSYGERKEI